jgi:hypothetical protein
MLITDAKIHRGNKKITINAIFTNISRNYKNKLRTTSASSAV